MVLHVHKESMDALNLQHLSNEFVSKSGYRKSVSCVLIVFCMPCNYCCDVLSIMTDWSDSESIKLLHLHIALNCYCMCVTFASAVYYHLLHYTIVGLTNRKCTATPMIIQYSTCVLKTNVYSALLKSQECSHCCNGS